MIRSARISDAQDISAIYSWYVEQTAITFETGVLGPEEMAQRIEAYQKNYPYLVWEEDGSVLGYAYAARYKSRAAFTPTTELSVYVRRDVRERGIGTALVKKLIEELKENYPMYYTAAACITDPNPASFRLFEKPGFFCAAKEHNVGYKLGS